MASSTCRPSIRATSCDNRRRQGGWPALSEVEDLLFERGIAVRVNGEWVYLRRVVDHEGEVLESYVTKTRNKPAALAFMKTTLKRLGTAEKFVTDGLRSYKSTMTELGCAHKQETGRWANNGAENSHLPFRRRERAMLRFRRMKSLQKFASVHASVHNHFALERHLVSRQVYEQRRSAALAEWQIVAAYKMHVAGRRWPRREQFGLH